MSYDCERNGERAHRRGYLSYDEREALHDGRYADRGSCERDFYEGYHRAERAEEERRQEQEAEEAAYRHACELAQQERQWEEQWEQEQERQMDEAHAAHPEPEQPPTGWEG
jgi:hypothetical protein